MSKTILSIRDVSRTDIERLIAISNEFLKERQPRKTLPPFIAGLLFFAASTRTQIGFEAATYRLGGNTFTLKETKFEKRMSVAESLEDTVRVVQAYADILCVRHPDANVFSRVLQFTSKPIINCGNGYDEHPTQALLDLMTINNLLGRLDKLEIAIVGDLLHMKTSHSLLLALSKFKNVTVRCIIPSVLRMPKEYKDVFKKSGNTMEETEKLDLIDADVIYMAGFAARTPIGLFGTAIRKKYCIDKNATKQLKDEAIILCPLPRIDEISPEVDQTKFAKYFVQSDYGLFMRMAIIAGLLN